MFKLLKLLIVVLLLLPLISIACTDFRVISKDNTVIITRSMEFALDLKSNVVNTSRNTLFNTSAPNGKPGLSWRNKYGYVYLDGLNTGRALDGMNEQGLSFEALYLPGETQYQIVPVNQESHALPYLSLGDWILGNFSNVDEVKVAIQTLHIFSQELPQMKNVIFPLHFSVFDRSGKGIVIEYIGGKLFIYDNALGILTNSPTYDWHIINLRNFVNLTPMTPNPILAQGITFTATGQGSGMLGLPGDISPPSRFIKIAVLLKNVLIPNTAIEALNVAQHIINNVDIPLGFVREIQAPNKVSNELTQWVVFKDLKNNIFYYRTYGDLTLHAIDLKQINFNPGAPQFRMPIKSPQFVIDMTQKFMGK